MTVDTHTRNKSALAPLRAAMADFDSDAVQAAQRRVFAPDAKINLCFPFGAMIGPEDLYNRAYAPLFESWPDLERRDTIVMAGRTSQGADWVGCCGYYTGTFASPWLDIPPTGHQVAMRFHEFYRFVDGRVVSCQALWDIPEVMMQAGAWPLAPSLGREWHVPGPATQDGFVPGPHDKDAGARSCRHVLEMLDAMKRHPLHGGPDIMEMERYWHPRMNWYGPSGIGTGRGVAGFRNWHQIPFLAAMPDRGQAVDGIEYHFFGDRNYAAVTGWPNMVQTLTHGGWMGIAPAGRRITLRSLDFWRIESGLIRENWVLVDLLDVYDQLGVDVFERMREFNKARRQGVSPETGRALRAT